MPAGAAPPEPASKQKVEVEIGNLRSAKGQVRLCLTRDPAYFPDCRDDPRAHRLSVPAGSAGLVVIPDVAPGAYALTLLHDENGNGRLDTFMGVPREGFGFSRNPAIRFGPPPFEDVRFRAGEVTVRQKINVKYLL